MTQVGYPLAHGCEYPLKCVSSDRFVALTSGSVSPKEDQYVGDLVFLVGKVMEGRGLLELMAEGSPDAEDLTL